MILIVTYDLKNPSTEYNNLFEYLKSHEGWSHYMSSTWLIATDKTPQRVADEMMPHVSKGDRFLVARFSSEYQGLLPKQAWEWIHKNLK